MAAGEAVPNVLRRAIATRPRKVIIAVTAFLGVAVPALMVAGDPANRTFATVSAATLGLMTVPLPFLGALLAIDLGRAEGESGRAGPMLAGAATIVVPLGLWLILGLGFLKPAQPWLTPFPGVQRLLSGDMSGLAWPQWTVMALLWVGGLNALGAARLRR